MCSNNSSQPCKDSLSTAVLAHKDITTRFHSFYLDQGIRFTFPAHSVKLVQTPHHSFDGFQGALVGCVPATDRWEGTFQERRLQLLSIPSLVLLPSLGAFTAHTPVPSLLSPPLPTSPPHPQPYWFGGAENRILWHVSYLFCWSLWSIASLSLCLCLIRGRSVFQGSYKKKSFQDTYERSRGKKYQDREILHAFGEQMHSPI